MEMGPIITDITNTFDSIIMSATSRSVALIVKSPLQSHAVNITLNTSDTIGMEVLITTIEGDLLKRAEIKNNASGYYERVVVGIIMAYFIENCPDINYFKRGQCLVTTDDCDKEGKRKRDKLSKDVRVNSNLKIKEYKNTTNRKKRLNTFKYPDDDRIFIYNLLKTSNRALKLSVIAMHACKSVPSTANILKSMIEDDGVLFQPRYGYYSIKISRELDF